MWIGIFRWVFDLILDHLMVTKGKGNISVWKKLITIAIAGLIVSSIYLNYHLSKKAIAYAKAGVIAEKRINKLENTILDNYGCIADAKKIVRKETIMNR
jgi:hypothetical protein